MKQKAPVTPTPYSSPERAALAHAIAAAADAGARKAALSQAAQSANAAVMQAISDVEAAEAVLAEAGSNAVKHLLAKTLGDAGAPPMTTAQARAAVIRAQDTLEECRATRAALKTELAKDHTGVAEFRVQDAARAVIRAETQQRAITLAAECNARSACRHRCVPR